MHASQPHSGVYLPCLRGLVLGISHRLAFKRVFSPAALAQVAQASTLAEAQCAAEFLFVAEKRLAWRDRWHRIDARQRALDLFGRYRLWDTEHNVGVLIYVLWSSRQVEIVADRGVAKQVEQAQWTAWCGAISQSLQTPQAEIGIAQTLETMAQTLAQGLPPLPQPTNEIADQVHVL
jgi:uncharacterized membrane protein